MPTATTRHRLSGREIAAVLQARQQRAGRFVVVHVRRGGGAGRARIAVIASRRVGNAVARNRAKRVLREATRTLSWRPGTDVVLIARAACAASSMGVVRSELHRLATALEVLDGQNVGDRARAGSMATPGSPQTPVERVTDGAGELDR